MILSDLIKVLELFPPEMTVIHGFGKPHSWRGSYEDVAFIPMDDTTVGEMLKHARSALGATFTGYKGGEYEMSDFTDTHFAEYGECSFDGEDPITSWMLTCMLHGGDEWETLQTITSAMEES